MQRHEIINQLFSKYGKYGASQKGIQILVDRALNRGYKEKIIYSGLDRVLCKNYTRNAYRGIDAFDEKFYIQDEELRAIMQGREPALWA